MDLLEKIHNRQAVVSVVGLGYVGLPLATVFAQAGYRVVGLDVDQRKVDSINRGQSYIDDVPSSVLGQVTLGRDIDSDGVSGESGAEPLPGLVATSDYDALTDADVVIICVPTPLSKTRVPDLSHIIATADDIAGRLRRGMLVVLESTTYPGATEELVLPRLQHARGQDLEVGKDFFLVFSPERVDPGRTDYTISNTPKVVGGMTQRCGEMAAALYGSVVQQVVPVSTPAAAEMVKMLENTFRATNIALVNEIAIMCDRLGINVWEVIEGARTKPFGFMPFYPGPGLGGHCLPVDPQYLAWKLKNLNYNARFIQLADEVNMAMPQYWVTKVQDALNALEKSINGSSVLVLGVTYKPDTSDIRESPALDIIELLLEKGARVTYHDPHAPELDTEAYRLTSLGEDELGDALVLADCVMVVTDHSSYDWPDVRRKSRLIVDTRNAMGFKHSGVGRGIDATSSVTEAASANGS